MEGKYRTILADPPWRLQMAGQYNGKTRNERPRILPYPTMPLEQIKSLPVAELAETGAHLWLWVTTGKLIDGKPVIEAGFELLRAWGFTYLQMLTWTKPSGFGNYFLSLTEHILFAYKNRCEFNRARYIKNAYDEVADAEPIDESYAWGRPKAGQHSRKPVGSYQLIESVSDEPRIELFARPISPLFPKIPGWSTWGNEIQSDIAFSQQPLPQPEAGEGNVSDNQARND